MKQFDLHQNHMPLQAEFEEIASCINVFSAFLNFGNGREIRDHITFCGDLRYRWLRRMAQYHDTKWEKTHPCRDEVNGRLQNQNKQIT